MAPLTISPIVPDGIYRIRSLVRPDLLFEQQTDGEGTVKLATLDESKGSQLASYSSVDNVYLFYSASQWDLSADVLENRYTIFNPGTPCRLGFKVSPGRPWESVPASERFAVPTLWTIEPRHEAFVYLFDGFYSSPSPYLSLPAA